MDLNPWESEDAPNVVSPGLQVWVRRDLKQQVRAKITFYDKVGAVTDFFFPREEQPRSLRIPHGGSIGVQQTYADAALKEAGHILQEEAEDHRANFPETEPCSSWPMTPGEVADRVDVSEQGIITTPGAFYGCPAYVFAFWKRGSFAHQVYEITPEHRVLWPDLDDTPGAMLSLGLPETPRGTMQYTIRPPERTS